RCDQSGGAGANIPTSIAATVLICILSMLTSSAQRLEVHSHLGDEELSLLPRREAFASPVPVIRENVISCLYYRCAREPALGVVRLRRIARRGAGRERI